MKLKNKQTGEIKELPDGFFCGDNLKKICEEWEDYKEPKGIQCIYYVNHFDAAKIAGVIVGFETKEEAEKAVEKLKAWKRLKDKGFRFDRWDYDGSNYQEGLSTGRIFFRVKDYGRLEENDTDLDLLFSQEDD